MTQGIRQFVNDTFKQTLPKLPEIGNTGFRREVMDLTIMAFGISVGSAATHYNHALKLAKAENPEAVATLGRPEDKKGGRKPVHLVDVIKVKTGEVVAAGLSKAKAEQLVAKAAATPNKPRLTIKAVEPVAADAAAPATETAAVEPAAETAAVATTEAVAA